MNKFAIKALVKVWPDGDENPLSERTTLIVVTDRTEDSIEIEIFIPTEEIPGKKKSVSVYVTLSLPDLIRAAMLLGNK